MTTTPPPSVLFLCTGNSARSQIAEALLNVRGQGRFVAESAGSHPADRINPFAVEVLRSVGIDWAGHAPRGFEAIEGRRFDLVITVCDNAREACPILPGHPITAHWGMPDPAAVEGDEYRKREAFRSAFELIARRVDFLVGLSALSLDRLVFEEEVQKIGR